MKEQEAGGEGRRAQPTSWDQRDDVYKWKSKYGGLEVSDAKRLKALEDENGRLKKLLADAMLDNAVLKDLAAKKNGDACRQAGCRGPCGERRACSIIKVDRSSVRYRSRRGDDADLCLRLRELAAARQRFGDRRLGLLVSLR